MNSYWHAPCAGLVRNSYLNKSFIAAGRSGRHGLLKRKFGLKDYWKAKHWQWNHWHWKQRPCEWGVSFPINSRLHLLVVEMGSMMQRVWHLSNVFPELEKKMNLASPLSRWSQLRDRETESCCGETGTGCVCAGMCFCF